jgi:predicted nucleic acid-binding protein
VIRLDTSFLVDLLRERSKESAGPATGVLDSILSERLAISVFVACELETGVELARDPLAERVKVEDLLAGHWVDYPDKRFPATYGRLLAATRRPSGAVPAIDLLKRQGRTQRMR